MKPRTFRKKPANDLVIKKAFWRGIDGSTKALSPTTREFYGMENSNIYFSDSDTGFKDAFLASVWAMRCIRVISQSIAGIPVIVRLNEQPVDKKHPLQMAVGRRSSNLWRYTVADMLIFGRAFWLPSFHGPSLKIQRLNPMTIEVDKSSEGIRQFIQRIAGAQAHQWDPDDLLYFYDYDPEDDLGGKSPTSWVLNTIGTDLALERFAKIFFENDATPAGILKTEQSVMDADATRYKEYFLKEFGGVNNSHKVALLGQGITYEPVTPNMKDLVMNELDEKTKRRIAAAYGVPTTVALMDDASNYSTSVEQRKSFYTETILPFFDNLLDIINDSPLLQLRYPGCDMIIDTGSIEALRQDMGEVSQRIQTEFSGGWRSFNEARELSGLPVVEHDFFIIPELGVMSTEDIKAGKIKKEEEAMPDAYSSVEIEDRSLCVMLRISSPDLVSIQSRLRGKYKGKWNDELHVTLCYSPSADDRQVAFVRDRLANLAIPSFELEPRSLRTFDNVGEHALHFRVTKPEELLKLQEYVYSLFEQAGVDISSYSLPTNYTPHITLGYVVEKVPVTSFNNKLKLVPAKLWISYGDETVLDRELFATKSLANPLAEFNFFYNEQKHPDKKSLHLALQDFSTKLGMNNDVAKALADKYSEESGDKETFKKLYFEVRGS